MDFHNSKKYFDLLGATEYFKSMMKDYQIKRKRNITYSDINTLLRDYRNEKLLALPESDILKDDVGEEIRKLKEFQSNFQHRQSLLKNNKNQKKNNGKKRENRTSFLISLEKFEKQGKLMFPIQNQKNLIKNSFYKEKELNPKKILYHKNLDKYIENYKRRRKNTIDTFSTKTFTDYDTILNTQSNLRTTMNLMHNRIENLSNDLENESRNLIHIYSNNIRNFTYNFEEWKKAQEFKLPEIRKGLKKYGGIK